jgi:alkylation response protein AidB-like acyl-CoA dehydrogenase|tara:strand:+ start:184 stop:1884 length:1701 start_codon:yes stop_codon:yes gene_type:complete
MVLAKCNSGTWDMSDSEYSPGDYRAPIKDILFALEHAGEAGRLTGWDGEFNAEILKHSVRFVEGVIAPTEPDLDTQPPRLINGRVIVSPLLAKNVKHFTDGGWYGLNVPKKLGGQGLPTVISNILFEMIAGASLNTFMVTSCATAALKLLVSEGSRDQQERYISGILSGEYNTTIVLSEPQAGSDLRLIQTTGTASQEGGWRIHGTKVFCSGADHDMNPNILHCILAQTEGTPQGAKGLSLFLCPAVRPDGTRNNISVTRIEDKMGLHAAPTCQVSFDGAEAEMLGQSGEGLKRMFTMMNAMRIDVAIQGVGLCQIALQRSMAYAESRIQGRSISTNAAGHEAVPINQHGDIRRMLLSQDALVKGTRALVYRTAIELELDKNSKLAAFLLPVCKVFASDAACDAADMAIQIHGGYGYVRDYQIEQILRDARVCRIFEGANGLHATNLATSLRKPFGAELADAFELDIISAIDATDPEVAKPLFDALERWRQSKDLVAAMTDPGMVAYDFMKLTGLIAFSASWSRLEAASSQADDPEHIRKLAKYVRDRMLPEAEFYFYRVNSSPTM